MRTGRHSGSRGRAPGCFEKSRVGMRPPGGGEMEGDGSKGVSNWGSGIPGRSSMEHTSQGWGPQVTCHCAHVSQAKGLETRLPPSE